MATTDEPNRRKRIHPLPLRSALRLNRPGDIWHKPALSVVAASVVPLLFLFPLDRLDLVLYTSGGSLCALYAHGLPYAARARATAWVCLGMIASVAVALTAAAVVSSTAVLVAVCAALAAAHKLVCDATRIGPPGNLIFTFIASSCAFTPQRLGDVPFHLLLTAGGAACAWIVVMAPGLVRPQGPQRLAVARALEAAARLLTGDRQDLPRLRHTTASAVTAAWHTLFLVPARTPAGAGSRATLERILVRAESVLARTPADSAAEAGRLLALAHDLRRNRPLPARAGRTEPAGVAADREAGRRKLRSPDPGKPRGMRALARALGPGSPLLPVGARLLVGSAAAGWASMALGVGRPYWAVVTAASVFQANVTLSWSRGLQRAVGTLLGLAAFVALLPVTRSGVVALVAVTLLCQFGAEALITRNYWLGSVCVTQMALLLVEFAGYQPARELVTDRLIDTVIGVAAGLLAAVLVTNRRAANRIDAALDRAADAQREAERLLRTGPGREEAAAGRGEAAGGGADGGGVRAGDDETAWARDRLAVALIELREAYDVASGEWWQRALPAERVALAERSGHQVLAALVRRLTADRAAPAA
ncbi:FUSC family protein [Streptomyces thermolineatus]|uniref:FUSC family protein n=1 Tax=Streptomyces thermolineatus TaxID=44033 RepID=UPI00385108F0